MEIKQIIIWGHKLHSHTHSYIHNGFFIGFNHLGYKTLWFDDNDNVSDIDFSKSLFITEHQVNKKIPCRSDCLYLTHYIDDGDYKGVPKENIIILRVSLRDFIEGDNNKFLNYNYESLEYGQKYEYHSKINDYNNLYIYWATDLLPYEIQKNIDTLTLQETKNEINFIGTCTEPFRILRNICNIVKIPFNQYGATFNPDSHMNKSVEDNVKLIQESLIAPAFQEDHQIQKYYIPCRIFKNISYGKMGITNNKFIYEMFDKKLIYDENIEQAFIKSIEFEKKYTKYSRVKELMEIVRDNHTYLNRINTIINYIHNHTNFRFTKIK